MNSTCPMCREPVSEVVVPIEYHRGGKVLSVNVSQWKCSECPSPTGEGPYIFADLALMRKNEVFAGVKWQTHFGEAMPSPLRSFPSDEIPATSVGFPDEESMACEDGLVENHHYRDLRWIDDEYFETICEHEKAMLEYRGDPNSDEAMDEFEDNECFCSGLEAGVASTVAALAAIGACPITSCKGGKAQGHYEAHPLVLCWCTEEQLGVILVAASEVDVNVSGGRHPGVLIWTHDHYDKMLAFAQALMASPTK